MKGTRPPGKSMLLLALLGALESCSLSAVLCWALKQDVVRMCRVQFLLLLAVEEVLHFGSKHAKARRGGTIALHRPLCCRNAIASCSLALARREDLMSPMTLHAFLCYL